MHRPVPGLPARRQARDLHTNTIEALNRQIRKIIKTRGSFPTEDAARKLLFLTIINAQQTWRRIYNWNGALAAFKIHFDERLLPTPPWA